MRFPLNILFILLIAIILPEELLAQDWEFESEKDGIKVYTREETGSLKSYMGETDIQASVPEILSMIEDVEKFKEWDDDISEIRVLYREKGKMQKYYIKYNVPWPFKDRDLCVEETINMDIASGDVVVSSKSIPDALPENDDNVRMLNYHQKWIIRPIANGLVHLVLEGFADPAGDIPAWVANLAITDTPVNMIRAIRERVGQ
jgi:hypothetical protein